VANLQLYAVKTEDRQMEPLSYAPAPASFLLSIDDKMDQSLKRARLVLEKHTRNANEQPSSALLWDVWRRNDMRGMLELTGDSAGASLAASGLYLLRKHVPSKLRKQLQSVSWNVAAITAVLAEGSAGTLTPIHGGAVEQKLRALLDISKP